MADVGVRRHIELVTVQVQHLVPGDVFRLWDIEQRYTPVIPERYDSDGRELTLLDMLQRGEGPRHVRWSCDGDSAFAVRNGEPWRYLHDTGDQNEGDETLNLLHGMTAETHLVMRISNDKPRGDFDDLYVAVLRIAPVTVQMVREG